MLELYTALCEAKSRLQLVWLMPCIQATEQWARHFAVSIQKGQKTYLSSIHQISLHWLIQSCKSKILIRMKSTFKEFPLWRSFLIIRPKTHERKIQFTDLFHNFNQYHNKKMTRACKFLLQKCLNTFVQNFVSINLCQNTFSVTNITNITSHFILHTVIDLHQVPITKLAWNMFVIL